MYEPQEVQIKGLQFIVGPKDNPVRKMLMLAIPIKLTTVQPDKDKDLPLILGLHLGRPRFLNILKEMNSILHELQEKGKKNNEISDTGNKELPGDQVGEDGPVGSGERDPGQQCGGEKLRETRPRS